MPKYGICSRCGEPSILGQIPCVEGEPWMCPQCASEFFELPPERAKDVKATLLEQLEKSEKVDDDKAVGA